MRSKGAISDECARTSARGGESAPSGVTGDAGEALRGASGLNPAPQAVASFGDYGIFLSDAELHRSGGFSTVRGGNTVTIEFASLFGYPVQLPSFTVAAVSPTSLFFTFPDVRPSLGRAAAGPVDILVTTGDQTTAHILPRENIPVGNEFFELIGQLAREIRCQHIYPIRRAG